MHFSTFAEICKMTHIKDIYSDVVKLCMFPFSLRGKDEEWLLALPKVSITS
jgi:hypothetical protein